MSIQLTQEQEDIVRAESPFLAIKAFAGTGKTTTLIEYSKLRPTKTFLYLTFNKGIAQNIRKEFPRNVEVINAHSLAYKKIGYLYKSKLQQKIRLSDIRDNLFLKRNREGNVVSKIIIDLINRFCYSNANNISEIIKDDDIFPIPKETIIDYMDIIWSKMEDRENEFPITHDFYLKIFQLSKPKLNKDYVLLDEAQDTNPATFSIIQEQMKFKSKVILVGDEFQAIYGFRGARNIFQEIQPDKVLYLTKSFRFGKNIAEASNAILSIANNKKPIVGCEKDDYINQLDATKNFAIITRTNSNLFLKACELAEKDKKMFFVGGYNSYSFYKIRDIEYLYNDKISSIRDDVIKGYGDFSNMMDTAEIEGDNELIYFGKIVDKYKGNTKDIITKINKLSVENKELADVMLATAHKSKGLEFDQVFLTNDYKHIINKKGDVIPFNLIQEEINILYVAASRAKIYLKMNSMLKRLLDHYHKQKEIKDIYKGINYKKIKKQIIGHKND